MKILVLTSSFPRYRNDWWAQFVLNIYRNLKTNKFNITIVAPNGPDSKNNEEIDGIIIRRFSYFYPRKFQVLTSGEGILYSGRKKLLNKIQVITFVLAEFFYTLIILVKNKFDIIHAHWILPQGLVAIMAKFIFRKPVIITVHGSDIFGLRRFDFIKKFVLEHCDACTVNSGSTLEAVKNLCPKANISLIPMGVDLQMFDKGKMDQKWRKNFGERSKIILGVGRLIKWKGFEYLLKAMPYVLSKLPNSKLVIVGSGPEEQNLKTIGSRLSLTLNEDLFLLGNIAHDKLSHIYASSDIFVSPSITNLKTGEREGQGLVILEALASRLPVVVSRSGGIVDLIDGESTGLLFEEKDYKDLSGKIIRILSDNTLRKKLSENGIKFIEKKYSWKIVAQQFSKLYEKKFNYKNYWRERLKKTGESLRGVGHKSYGEDANKLMYKKAQIQLEKSLKELKISLKGKTVLDAGAGIGMYTGFYLDRKAKVFAVDISDDALKIIKKKYPNVETKCCSLSEINNINKKFDIVHCFDVLYHITNERDWEKTIENLGKLSKEYIIIHNITSYWLKVFDFIFERKHIKVKKRNIIIEEKLNKLGFDRIGYYPTHILYVMPILHFMVNIAPFPFYLLDKFLINNLKLRGWECTGITIYKKKENQFTV